MKETQNPKPAIEIVQEQEQKSELKHIGRISPKKGHTLFEIHLKKFEIRPAIFEDNSISFNKNTPKKRKVIIDKNCLYISALNKKNAVKKLKKYYNIHHIQ